MTSYKPCKPYLIDHQGATHQATYRHPLDSEPVFLTPEGAVVDADKAQNVREAIVLDPEDEDVKALLTGELAVSELDRYALAVVEQVRAQITPSEPEPAWPKGTVLEYERQYEFGVAKTGARAVVASPYFEDDEWVEVAWHRDGLSGAQDDGSYSADRFKVIWKPEVEA